MVVLAWAGTAVSAQDTSMRKPNRPDTGMQFSADTMLPNDMDTVKKKDWNKDKNRNADKKKRNWPDSTGSNPKGVGRPD